MNQDKFNEYRIKYPNFIYEGFSIEDNNNFIKIIYNFEIEGLAKFNPYYEINKNDIKNKNIDKELLNYMVFNIGMIEIMSYFKCTCSKNIIVKCGYLDEYQINWFKKLFYNGLGEFLYTNGINVNLEDFIEIKCTQKYDYNFKENYIGTGNLIPIGGGKDSCVTMEIIKDEFENNTPIIMNPKQIHLDCIKAGGYNNYFAYKRILDKKIIDLNNQGFLNGHTPFSSLVAFTTYLCAYLGLKKNILLSNENSANEATVLGTNINHQYSKSYEFEVDFNNYTKKYFNIDIKYFSLLRPLNEYTIGQLFSNYKQYHNVFKSCNVGSKTLPWKWCLKCPKCLFVFIILSPHLYKEDLIKIFGADIYEDKDLLNVFNELLGYSQTKPFECVGMYTEVRYAVSLLIKKLNENNLPYLLKYYKDNYPLYLEHKFEFDYDVKNNLDEHFNKLLKKEVIKYV